MSDSAQMFIPQTPQPSWSSQTPVVDPPLPPQRKRSFQLPDLPYGMMAVGVLIFSLILGGGMYGMSLINTKNSFEEKISSRNREIEELLEQEPVSSTAQVIGQVQATYENPFDEDTAYTNPFDEYENPFEE